MGRGDPECPKPKTSKLKAHAAEVRPGGTDFDPFIHLEYFTMREFSNAQGPASCGAFVHVVHEPPEPPNFEYALGTALHKRKAYRFCSSA